MIEFDQSGTWPPEGPVRLFQEPLQRHRYVMGADVAEGLEHGDYSSAHVLDADSGLLVATWHDHTDPDLFGEQIAVLGRFYNNALIGVEINNHGHVTVAALRRLNYPRIFRRRILGQITEGFAPQYGWHTNKATKVKMIDELSAAIRDGTVDIRCEHTLAELRTYIREYTQGGLVKMHGSPYDDRVMSLAIAVQMIDYASAPDYEPEKKDDRGTLDWHLRRAQLWEKMHDEDKKVLTIGAHNRRRGT